MFESVVCFFFFFFSFLSLKFRRDRSRPKINGKGENRLLTLGYVWLEGWRGEKREKVGRMRNMNDEEDYKIPSYVV